MSNYQSNSYGSGSCGSCNSCNSCTPTRRCCGVCANKIMCFFVVALAAALGLIFGSVYAEQIAAALPAVIVFAAVMAIAIVALLIYRICERW